MRLLIVGVGQTLNFETREMEDVLQVMTPDGSVFSVPTTNEAAQGLVKLAMNGNGHQEDPEVRMFRSEDGHTLHDPLGEVVPGTVSISGSSAVGVLETVSIGEVAEGDFPDGADFFGGDDKVRKQISAKAERARTANLGISKNPPDRSGVPSYGISRVDEKGNPILPAAPDQEDEEDDPGEQA